MTFTMLTWLRFMANTRALGRFCYLSLAQVGVQWGEAEWTARDLWEAAS